MASVAPLTAVLAAADSLVGTRYRFGGTSVRTGIDCSAMIQRVFARWGVALPRTSRQMAKTGVRVPTDTARLRPGDVLLFAQRGTRISHAALYAGDGRIIHATPRRGVAYDTLSTRRGRWFLKRLVAVRRVAAQDSSPVDGCATSDVRCQWDAIPTRFAISPF